MKLEQCQRCISYDDDVYKKDDDINNPQECHCFCNNYGVHLDWVKKIHEEFVGKRGYENRNCPRFKGKKDLPYPPILYDYRMY